MSTHFDGKGYCRNVFLLLGQGPVYKAEFFVKKKRSFNKQINHLLCGWSRDCFSLQYKTSSGTIMLVRQPHKSTKEVIQMDNNSLSHTSWNCKYHIVFAPKYRRKAIYGKLYEDIGYILRTLCQRKKVNIIEAELCPNHVHMLVEISPSISVSSFAGYLKGKSSLMIFERHANLKYKYWNRYFWRRGYYVDTVGKNAKKIQEYIQGQLKEDLEYDQMTLKEYIDPFTGEPVKKKK